MLASIWTTLAIQFPPLREMCLLSQGCSLSRTPLGALHQAMVPTILTGIRRSSCCHFSWRATCRLYSKRLMLTPGRCCGVFTQLKMWRRVRCKLHYAHVIVCVSLTWPQCLSVCEYARVSYRICVQKKSAFASDIDLGCIYLHVKADYNPWEQKGNTALANMTLCRCCL